MPAPCMFFSCTCNDPLYSPDEDPKLFDASSAVFPLSLVGDPYLAGVAPPASAATTLDVSADATDVRVLY